MARLLILCLLCTGATALLKSSTFKPMHGHPDFKEAKNVCLSIREPCSGKLESEYDDNTNQFLAKKLNLEPIPADFKGEVLPSALMITRGKQHKLDKQSTAFQHSEHEWSESILPMFDFVGDLSQKFKAHTDKQLFSAVLMPQAPSAAQFMKTSTFDVDVLDSLLETTGHKTETKKLFCEDIKKEHRFCFNRVVHYRASQKALAKTNEPLEEDDADDDVAHKAAPAPAPLTKEHVAAAARYGTVDEEKGDDRHISGRAASALRQHMHTLRLHETTQSSGRNAVLVVRKDHMGWMNFVEVEQKFRTLLEEKCWKLTTIESTDTSAQKAIQDLGKADLVLANHGPHNEHMIWMPRKAGFIEDKNCQCSLYGYKELADQEDLHYSFTHGPNTDVRECDLQKHGMGICTSDKPRVVDFENEIQPAVESMIELLETKRSGIPSRCA